MMFDGLNEHGLSAAFLWLWATEYPGLPRRAENSLSIVDTVAYILGNFKSVAEVKSALTDPADAKYAAIWAEPIVQKLAPLHLLVRDAEGKSLIVEWIKGKPLIYDGPAVDDIGVLTNDPPYPEQVKELAKYRKVSPWDGLYGIPGDATWQSRFIRIAMLRRFAFMTRGPLPLDARQVAAHLINSVDVVYGANIEHVPDENLSFEDYTGPTIIRDHKSRVLYFKGHNNQSYRKIDLGQINFEAPLTASILADPMPTDPIYSEYQFGQDVTQMLNQ
jgi:choloylglycine hydrolase